MATQFPELKKVSEEVETIGDYVVRRTHYSAFGGGWTYDQTKPQPQPKKKYFHYLSPKPKKAGWISFTIIITNLIVDPDEAEAYYKALWAPGAVIPPCSITGVHGEHIDYGRGNVDMLYVIQGSMARSATDAPRPGLLDGQYLYAKMKVHEHIRHCTNCYKVDHMRRACPRSHCRRCREEGHWPPDCPKKQKSN